jgi:hypothetical protein
MVRYAGRAGTRTGLNGPQLGLKMSGLPGSVGHSIAIRDYIKTRVHALKPCNPTLHGRPWRVTYRYSPGVCKSL